MKYHLTLIRMAITKNKTKTTVSDNGEKHEPLYTAAGNLKQYSHWGKFLKKLKAKLPYDVAIPLLSIQPKEANQGPKEVFIYTTMFKAALYTKAKTWKETISADG